MMSVLDWLLEDGRWLAENTHRGALRVLAWHDRSECEQPVHSVN